MTDRVVIHDQHVNREADRSAGVGAGVGAEVPRNYLSIGEVLDALRDEFPDITISKIRFLESQGLLEPERTPSGYRKFFPADLARLRWVLQQQREKYLPLKVIRASLADAESAGLLPSSSGAGAAAPRTRNASSADARADARLNAESVLDATGDDGHRDVDSIDRGEGTHIDAPPRALGEGRHPSMQSRNLAPGAGRTPLDEAPTTSSRPQPVPVPEASRHGEPSPNAVPGPRASDSLGSRNPLIGIGTGVSLTLNELASASGLAIDDIRLLEQFGLIIGRHVFAATYYDEDALVAAKATAAFRVFGVEPRHLRMYKTAADREADFFSQIVTPLLRRRKDDARLEAAETLETLARLGEQLRVVALRQVLRASLDSR